MGGRYKTREEKLESQQQLSSIYNTVGASIFHLTVEGEDIYRFASVNRTFSTVTGLTEEQVVGKLVNEVIPEPSLTMVLEKYKQAIREKKIITWEETSNYPTGELVGEVSITPVFDEKGNCTCLVGSVLDITNRKRIENELLRAKEKAEENEKKFRDILNNTNFHLWAMDGTKYHYVSKNWFDFSGQLPETSPTLEAWASTVHPEDLERATNILIQHLKTKTEHYNYFRLRRHDGVYRDFYCHAVPIFDDQNQFKYFQGYNLDITEQKKAEKELLKQNERLESLLRISQYKAKSAQDFLDYALQEAIDLTSSKIGYIFFYNESTREFNLNTWSKEVMGECAVMNPQTIYDLDDTGCWGEAVRQRKPIIMNNYPDENQHKKGMPDGHIPLSRFLTIPIFIDNFIVAVVGVANKQEEYHQSDVRQLRLLMDTVWRISERERLFDDLREAKEHAEESDRLKSAFLANMSHEIRTPMNGILGFAELLKEPHLTDEEQQHYISIIDRSGKRMLNIINDIVNISKVEAGLMDVSIQETNINEKTFDLYTFFHHEVEKKGLKLSVKNALPSVEAVVKTDQEKLFAILTNLVKNAIKYTDKGAIEFGYEKKDGHLEFFVKDTGSGIPKKRQEAIFERFVQGDVPNKRAQDGAGLGLSISKAYVEMLGGKIWVVSEVGEGASFYFTIPYNTEFDTVSQNTSSGPGKDYKVKGLKILIAEDDIESQYLITTVIKQFGREVMKAATGVEAVELCRTNPDIDLILMDVRMPVLNGYEATQQIRKFNKEVVIIAQTAYAMAGDREKAIDAGCSDYLPKPIKINDLKGLIYKYFTK